MLGIRNIWALKDFGTTNLWDQINVGQHFWGSKTFWNAIFMFLHFGGQQFWEIVNLMVKFAGVPKQN